MIYFEKNDIWDAVWLRYKESYNCTNDCDDYVPVRDINYFCSFLRRNMRADLKQAKKDAKKIVKRLRRADRKARRKSWRKAVCSRIKGIFMRKKKVPQKSDTLPIPIQDNESVTVKEQPHE